MGDGSASGVSQGRRPRDHRLRKAWQDGFKMEIIATNGRYPGDKATCEASAGMLQKVEIDATCNAQRFPLFKRLHRAYKSGKRQGAAALTDPKAQQAAFEAVTDPMKAKVTHKIYFKVHDVIGYSARLAFTLRHDEMLFPWEIVVKQ